MSVRSYRGNRGKNVFEIANFSKGVNVTNAAMNAGAVKELVNMKVSPDGMSLRPREPYMNYVLIDEDNDEIIKLSNDVGVFTSKQFPNHEYIIDLKGTRETEYLTITNYRVVDGDTILDNDTGTYYRFLLVDAPEMSTGTGVLLRFALVEKIDGKPLTIMLDGKAPSWKDAFGRTLGFVIDHEGDNLSEWLIETGQCTYIDTIITRHQYIINNPDAFKKADKNGDYLTIVDSPGTIPVAYKRLLDTLPVKVDGRPSYKVTKLGNINMGEMLKDIEVGYSYVPLIEIRKTRKSTEHFDVNYTPFIPNKMPSVDGMVVLVDIYKHGIQKEQIYKGILSIEIDVPFIDESETLLDFDNPIIAFKTFKSNVKKVRFEDLDRHSQNLLDHDPIETTSFYGQDAIDNGFPYPSIRAILFRDEKGNAMSQLQRNRKYYIDPLVGLPLLNDNTNGYKDYDGYAYKWEIIVHNNVPTGIEETIHTLDWVYTRNMNGSLESTLNTFIPLTGTDEELLNQWLAKDRNNRFAGSTGFPDPVVNKMVKGDIYRRAKPSSTLKVFPTRHEKTYQAFSAGPIEIDDWVVIKDPFPDEYRFKNLLPIRVDPVKVSSSSGESFATWQKRNFGSTTNPKATPYSTYYYYADYIESGGWIRTYSTSLTAFPTTHDYFIYDEVGELSRLHTRLSLFNNSTSGVQVRLFIAPSKKKGSYTEEERKQLDLNAQIVTSAYMPYQSEEKKIPQLNNTTTILDSRYIAFFEDMLILYGSTTHGNVIYMSDFSNLNYFPFKYSLDQIPQEIVHIHPFQDIMVVFTKSDVWAIQKIETENEFGVITTDFVAKRILQNLFIDVHLKGTIKTVGKYIMVMLEDKVLFLKPNSFTGDNTDLSYQEVSAPIGGILKNPEEYVRQRLKYYNIFTEEILYFDLYSEVDNKDFKIILSTFIKEVSTPYMLELMFDGTRGIWTISDTLSTAYPAATINGIRYMKGHPTADNGVVISDTSGEYKYRIMDKDSAHMDIKQYAYTDFNIVERPIEHIFEPINLVINLGNLPITNHLNKRFHEIQMEVTNINVNTINMAYSFKVDGSQQQTSEEVVMSLANMKMQEHHQVKFETIEELNSMSFQNFLLDLSKFPLAERITTKIRANGRGRVASFIVSFNTTNDFEIFRFLVIYKEQTSRKVI